MSATLVLRRARATYVAAGVLLFMVPGSAGASGPRTDRDTELLKAHVAAQQAQMDELRCMLDEQQTLLESVISTRGSATAAAPPAKESRQ